MVKIALLIAAGYALAFATWLLYLAAMNLKSHLKKMGVVARAHAYVAVALAVVFDVVLNVVVGTIVFADAPREWLLTTRLKRYHYDAAYHRTWRARLAEWVCTHLLDQFDPSGDHC